MLRNENKEEHIPHFLSQNSVLLANGYRAQKHRCPQYRRGKEIKLLNHHHCLNHRGLCDFLFKEGKRKKKELLDTTFSNLETNG